MVLHDTSGDAGVLDRRIEKLRRMMALRAALFSQRAFETTLLARESAEHREGYLGTGRFLLTLLDNTGGYAVDALRSLAIEPDHVRVLFDSGADFELPPQRELDDAQKLGALATSLSIDVAENLAARSARRGTTITTGHLLLGLVGVPGCFAVRALRTLGAPPRKVRRAVRAAMARSSDDPVDREPVERHEDSVSYDDLLEVGVDRLWESILTPPEPVERETWRLLHSSVLDRDDGTAIHTLEFEEAGERQLTSREVVTNHAERTLSWRTISPADERDLRISTQALSHENGSINRATANYRARGVFHSQNAAERDVMLTYLHELAAETRRQLQDLD